MLFLSLKYFLQILIGSPARIFSHVTRGPCHSLRSSSTHRPLYNKHSQGYFRLQAWSFWPMYEDYALQSTGEILTALLLSLGRFPPTTAYMYKRTILTCTVVNNFKYIFTRIFKILMTMTRNLFLFHPLCFDIVVLLKCKNCRCDSKHKLPISKWHKKRWNVQLLKNGWTIRPSIKLVEGINHKC